MLASIAINVLGGVLLYVFTGFVLVLVCASGMAIRAIALNFWQDQNELVNKIKGQAGRPDTLDLEEEWMDGVHFAWKIITSPPRFAKWLHLKYVTHKYRGMILTHPDPEVRTLIGKKK